MKPEDLYGEIVAFCKSNTDEAIIKKYSKYFKGGQYDAYGLPQHLLQNKITDILNRSDIDFQIKEGRAMGPGWNPTNGQNNQRPACGL